MKIQEVIETTNQMQADGVIERYAIGGAVGATFYLEPVATLDVDIFVAFKDKARHLQFIESGVLDRVKFEDIVARHRLIDTLLRLKRQLLEDTP